jgi:hypothetical protein
MANRRAMKLFAVAILAGSSSASADTVTQVTRGASPATRAASGDWRGTIDIAAIKPRELANGRAACGNTGGKSSYDCKSMADDSTAEQRALLAASIDYQAAERAPIVINPRLLANARPACGNTGGKVSMPDDCSAADIRAAAAADKAYEQASTKHYAKVQIAYAKLMAATATAVRADPSLRARLLINGRPACGNTMGKSSPPAFCREDAQ